jgi:phosphoribosylformimino-5-aminoimidazole carboxamide ribotide isomerase
VLVIPAIDLMGGQVVRLQEGQRERATVYHPRPEKVAERFVHEGAKWIHVVDLDGAFAGRRENRAAVRAICEAAAEGGAHVQVGGGVRDLVVAAELIAEGAQAVVLGTAAVKRFDIVREACERWPGRVVVAVDARGGKVAVEGWAEASDIEPADLAARAAKVGAAGILYTDISRDGLLGGPNIAATAALAKALAPCPVIASGGISDLEDLRGLAVEGVPACVIGRALYEGAFTLPEAIEAVSGPLPKGQGGSR